jgi:glycogen debranching enzyme
MTDSTSLDGALNIWGGGQLLAFSGMEGPTDYSAGLVARTSPAGCGVHVKLPAGCELVFSDASPRQTLLAGDFFELVVDAGTVRGAFLDAYHLLVEGPCRIASGSETVAVRQKGSRTLVAPAVKLNPALLDADLSDAMAQRRAWLESLAAGLPEGLPPARRRTLLKALSVMKTQACTPEGVIRHRWTTPDRWPHQGMWLWDSAFHAIGWRHADPSLARDMLLAVLDAQKADGMVAIRCNPGGIPNANYTQPPVLTLAAVLVNQVQGDEDFLEDIYPRLCRYVDWDRTRRDSDGGGLPEWAIEGHPGCRSGESGWDNSPRFDAATQLDAVDFSALLALECELLAGMAGYLGYSKDARTWEKRHRQLCLAINRRLWDESQGFYFDCLASTGEKSPVMSPAGFYPLLCGAASPEQTQRLAEHLENPKTFATPVPVPTVAACQEKQYYSKDMWRGPMWVNVNWLIAMGLERYDLHAQAHKLRLRTMEEIERWYLEYGAIFEFYDDRGEVPPPKLLRKGKNAPQERWLHQVIFDYGWSATLYADMAFSMAKKPLPSVET